MIRNEVLTNYAQALLSTGVEPLVAEEALVSIVTLFDGNKQLKAFFESPRVKASVKKKAIRQAFEKQVPNEVLNFLLVLVDKRREAQLAQIVEAIIEENDKKFSRVPATIYLSRDLSAEVLNEGSEFGQQIKDAIDKNREAFGLPAQGKLDIRPKVKIVPEQLGGAVIRIGDYLWDGSVRRYLNDWVKRVKETNAQVKKAWQ